MVGSVQWSTGCNGPRRGRCPELHRKHHMLEAEAESLLCIAALHSAMGRHKQVPPGAKKGPRTERESRIPQAVGEGAHFSVAPMFRPPLLDRSRPSIRVPPEGQFFFSGALHQEFFLRVRNCKILLSKGPASVLQGKLLQSWMVWDLGLGLGMTHKIGGNQS